jgi:hypothetical protein
LEKQKA